MNKRLGKQTIKAIKPPKITASAAITGPKEGEGPLGLCFDMVIDDMLWGEKSWEKAESKLIKEVYALLNMKMSKELGEVNYIISGDLMNQCISTTFGLRDTQTPIIGIYGACSTMAEGLGLGTMLVDGGFADNIICLAASHFCSAEKQFRYPLELGTQRTPTSQWTVTGAGGIVLSNKGSGVEVQTVTTGKIIDLGISDVNNMGAAMAPAAADTIFTHFMDTGLDVAAYDLIITGDLGKLGSDICSELLMANGLDLGGRLNDCGLLIYDIKNQDVHLGGSGCGCSASVLASYIIPEMEKGTFKNVLFIATGSLHSSISLMQGESIPCIAHAVSLHLK